MKKFVPMLILLLLVSVVLVSFTQLEFVKDGEKKIVVPDDYSTIQEAINAASEGDIVFVKSGTYFENLVINKSISLIGENKETTTIHRREQRYPDVYPTLVVREDRVNVTDFTIKNDVSSPFQITSGAVEAHSGVHLINVRDCNIFENIITDNGYGIWIYASGNNNVFDNEITNSNHGIFIEHSSDNTLFGNTVSNCCIGIWLSSAAPNLLRNNNLMNNSRNFGVSGTKLTHYHNDVDSSNLVNGKRIYYLFDLVNAEIVPPHFPDAGFVILINCTGTTVKNLDISNDYGLFLLNTSKSTVTCNNITNATKGIWLKSSFEITISKNSLNSISEDAILLENSQRILIDENSVEHTEISGICLKSSTNNILCENTLAENSNNGIYLEDSSNNTIIDNELTNSVWGIALWCSPKNKIESNKISSPKSENDNLTCGVKGITLDRNSDNTNIIGNIITNCELGIVMESYHYYIYVAGNEITTCEIGLQIRAFESEFTENSISNSSQCAVYVSYGTYNVFHNNNFANNAQQISHPTVNHWDNGIVGNYWSDYTGLDSDGDGIGDSPYIINEDNQDNYPLVNPTIILGESNRQLGYLKTINKKSP